MTTLPQVGPVEFFGLIFRPKQARIALLCGKQELRHY